MTAETAKPICKIMSNRGLLHLLCESDTIVYSLKHGIVCFILLKQIIYSSFKSSEKKTQCENSIYNKPHSKWKKKCQCVERVCVMKTASKVLNTHNNVVASKVGEYRV